MLIVVDGGRWDLPLLGAGVPFGLPFIGYSLLLAIRGRWLLAVA